LEKKISFRKGNVRLRALEPEDVAYLYQWENNPETWKVGNTLLPFSKFTLEQFIQNASLDIFQTRQVRWMIDRVEMQKNIPVGTIDLFDFDPLHKRAGIGLLISHPKDRRQQLASKALEILLDYCFHILQLHQVYCNIGEHNKPSIRFFTKYGFKTSGIKKDWKFVNGFWEDELMFQLLSPL